MKKTNKMVDSYKIGILTFHWADNYGAMLQAYGLKMWLSRQMYVPFIINYSLARLEGRDWLVPYMPLDTIKSRLKHAIWMFSRNILTGKGWFQQKRNMRQFRENYLTADRKTLSRLQSLSDIDADVLIVGSDQIWNPDITFGLLPAYFGAFENAGIRKTIAYGASLGSNSLPGEYEAEFAGLLDSVDSISMREKGAAEYIRSRFHRQAVDVMDPVFLLNAREWIALESRPVQSNYIFYYETEPNENMRRAACTLAEEKGLKVIALAYRVSWPPLPFHTVYSAGPSQFLGYIHRAEYVLTNSFHAVAFSMIFNKLFLVYNHSSRGARIGDLLSSLGLTERMATQDHTPDIDGEIDWMELERRMSGRRKQSEDFLFDALAE